MPLREIWNMDKCAVCGSERTVIAQYGTGEAFCYEHGNALNEEYQEWRANHPAPDHKTPLIQSWKEMSPRGRTYSFDDDSEYCVACNNSREKCTCGIKREGDIPYLVTTDIVCWNCRSDLWNGSWVFSPIETTYCSQCKKYMDPLDQPRKALGVQMKGKDLEYGKSIDDFDWDKYYREQAGIAPLGQLVRTIHTQGADPRSGGLPGDKYPFKKEDPCLECFSEVEKLKKEISSLVGHVRRLEKSNQKLGDELHRLTEGEGWNKNVKSPRKA